MRTISLVSLPLSLSRKRVKIADSIALGYLSSWSPALNETFTYGVDRIRGVNLGGWLNTEPFIVPGLYEKYYNTTPRAVDEYTLCQAMGANRDAEMEEHYKTFITEQDLCVLYRPLSPSAFLADPFSSRTSSMEIAAAGFNFVRIPIGFWAVETEPGEPYLQGVSWTYFLKAIEWARKVRGPLFHCKSPELTRRNRFAVRPPHQPRLARRPGLAERLECVP